MAQTRHWQVSVDDQEYDISFESGSWSGKHSLTVNGKIVPFPYIGLRGFVGWEVSVPLGEKTALLAARGRALELVIDGVCAGSGAHYTPLRKMPWWGLLFTALSLAVVLVPVNSLLPFAAALAGAVYCARTATSPAFGTVSRVLICLGITAAAWLMAVLLITGILKI